MRSITTTITTILAGLALAIGAAPAASASESVTPTTPTTTTAPTEESASSAGGEDTAPAIEEGDPAPHERETGDLPPHERSLATVYPPCVDDYPPHLGCWAEDAGAAVWIEPDGSITYVYDDGTMMTVAPSWGESPEDVVSQAAGETGAPAEEDVIDEPAAGPLSTVATGAEVAPIEGEPTSAEAPAELAETGGAHIIILAVALGLVVGGSWILTRKY